MTQILVGIGAGAAAALLFASVASGSIFSIPLFYLAPLPILIAALGWSHWSGLIAAIAASASLGAIFGWYFFAAFSVGVGLPAWWLGYLTMLARPVEHNGVATLEWYPPGRLVVWAALAGATVVAVAILSFGFDADSVRNGLRRGLERAFRLQAGTPDGTPLQGPGGTDPAKVIDFLVLVLPPAAAIITSIVNAVNLWLAARIATVSGRLKRPMPDLMSMTFPALVPMLLAASILGTFGSDLIGAISSVFAASLFMAYAVLGFAVLHAVTRGAKTRGLLLAGTYTAVFILGWPVLLMSLFGLADTAFGIRSRVAARHNLPPPKS